MLTPVFPIPVIMDQSGKPLNNGAFYVGEPDQDPEVFPKPAFWDADGTDPIDQTGGIPVIGGYIRKSGSPGTVYAEDEYSTLVRDRFGTQIYYSPRGDNAGFIAVREEVFAALAATTGASLVGGAVQAVTSRAVMAALGVNAVRSIVIIGDESLWQWRTGDYTARVTSDPLRGIYQPHATISTGTGCWVRQWDGVNGRPEWFGAVTGGPDCLAALQACVTLCPVTILQQKDYFISDTWVINTPWRRVVGRGFVTYGSEQGTRVILSNGTKRILQIGPSVDPGGNPGITYLRQVHVEGVSLVRDALNIPTPTPADSPCALAMRFVYQSSLKSVAAWESAIGFQFYGCVASRVDDCFAFRSAAATTTTNDIWYGYHFIGDPPVIAGGNASLYVNRCIANLSGMATIPISSGFKHDGSFVDVFLMQVETLGGRNGIWLTGTGAGGTANSNIDIHIIQPVIDGPLEYGIHSETPAPGAMIDIVSPYVGANSSTVACIYLEGGGGLTTITGGQIIGAVGAGDPLGLHIRSQGGVHTANLKITDCVRPVFVETGSDITLDVLINSTGVGVTGADGLIVVQNCTKAVIEPTIKGPAGLFPAGVVLANTGNSNVEVRCTRIDAASLSGGAANKLLHNGTSITATGAFGTDCLAAGVMV